MATSYFSASMAAASHATLDVRSTSSSANPTLPEIHSPTGYGRDAWWSGSDRLSNPVDLLPKDPFEMSGDIRDGAHGGYWMEFFNPAYMTHSDPFGMMSLENVLVSLVEDFRATYGYCNYGSSGSSGGGGSQVGGIEYYSDVPYHPYSDVFLDMEANLSAAIAGWVEDIRALSMEYPVLDGRCSGRTFLEDYLVSCYGRRSNRTFFDNYVDPCYVLPSDPFEMELEFARTGRLASLVGDMNRGIKVAANSFFSDNVNCKIKGLAAELVMDAEPSVPYGDNYLHDGLFFALGYLEVDDLLSVEMVCKSLRTAVVDDPLLWKCIKINSILSDKITDDALLQLTQRAQGNLHSLSLVSCAKITDDGLRRVLKDNSKLMKLCVPDCVKLSIDGMINNLNATPGIKHIQLGRLFSVSSEHFEDLKLLLGIEKSQQQMAHKPRFYHNSRYFLECDDSRALDIEMCPICNNYKLVYDCSLESCMKKGPEACRACDICIKRCVRCGKCINANLYIETFCLEHLCLECCENCENPTIW